jgi:hypothetical protein
VRAGERISFGTYFNAFAASYWRRWTTVKEVRLNVRTSGRGTVSVYRSNARGSLQHVETKGSPATPGRNSTCPGPLRRRRLVLVRRDGRN